MVREASARISNFLGRMNRRRKQGDRDESPYLPPNQGIPWIMFDAVRNNKRIVQVFRPHHAPFRFWGSIPYVRHVSDEGVVAKIGEREDR